MGFEQLSNKDQKWVRGERILEVIEIIHKQITMENQELTFGQKAVGLNFNPSGDDMVANTKQVFASIIDNAIGDPSKDTERRSYLYNIIRTAGISACISASMAVVKFITWKE